MTEDESQELACLLLEGVPEAQARRTARLKADDWRSRRNAFGRSRGLKVTYSRDGTLTGWLEQLPDQTFTDAVTPVSPKNHDLDVWELVDAYCTPKQREAIGLVYARDNQAISQAEAARQLGIDQSSLYERIQTGCKRIRQGVEHEQETGVR